jgi:ribosomal protein S6
MMKSLFEENGGTYHMECDYRIPNLELPEEQEYEICMWGLRRLDYLKKHRKSLYLVLLTSCKMNELLHEIDIATYERREIIGKRMVVVYGTTEQPK